MKNETAYERNEMTLGEILIGPMNIVYHIDNYERSAIDCGDLARAIKYNWLRNTYKQGLLTDDEVFMKLLTIHADSNEKEIVE